jgi:hypothetical protein
MRTKWTLELCAALASAAILAGCTQEVADNQDQNRTPIDSATNQPRQNLQIALTGCLGTGTGTNQYVLTHVRPAPLASQPSDALSSLNLTIPENSAVRLSTNETEQLTKLVGETVNVQGLLRHDGRDTIGTSGRPTPGPNQPESRTDQSQAAATGQHHSDKVRQEAGPIATQSMNNGTFAEVRVQRIEKTGERCSPTGTEDRR